MFWNHQPATHFFCHCLLSAAENQVAGAVNFALSGSGILPVSSDGKWHPRIRRDTRLDSFKRAALMYDQHGKPFPDKFLINYGNYGKYMVDIW